MNTSARDYTQFACPNAKCKMHGQFHQGNIVHHSWIGKHKNINRLRCKECRFVFSENRGTLREKARIGEDKQERLLKCFRWGVCDAGAADICEVNHKTVQLFRTNVARHAREHHAAHVQKVNAPGIQVDELRAKQGGKITWAAVAMAMGSFLILAVTLGARNQSLADRLLAEIWGRCCRIGMILSDGWRCYYSAIARCYGRLYRPRKSAGQKGKKKERRLKFDKVPFYGQVIKQTMGRYQLCAVKCRAVLGTMAECLFFIKVYELGTKINTSHIERWFGTLRCHIASLRRKSRCLGKTPAILGDRIWIFVSLHNWILTHESLTTNNIRRTPAMAAGLIDRPLTYREYLRLPIFGNTQLKSLIAGKYNEMRSEEKIKAAKRTKWGKGEERVLWRAPPQKMKEVA